jgi:aspartyl-tRNA(Asn)/glutamyl-tRNA(Gln) amidotransferase subunit C
MVSREQVRHVANLAKLALTPEEEIRFGEQLSRILEYVDELAEIEDSAEERTHVAIVEKELRPDEIGRSLPREEILALAPKADGETFLVPPVLEGGEGM